VGASVPWATARRNHRDASGGWAIVSSCTTGQNPASLPFRLYVTRPVFATLNNKLIAGGTGNTDESIIPATNRGEGPFSSADFRSYHVQVPQGAGTWLAITAVGTPDGVSAPITEPLVVHYMIINPSPRP
jgi:hypothetical protein